MRRRGAPRAARERDARATIGKVCGETKDIHTATATCRRAWANATPHQGARYRRRIESCLLYTSPSPREAHES
eukprot:632887-Prymnesium_polylepis.1